MASSKVDSILRFAKDNFVRRQINIEKGNLSKPDMTQEKQAQVWGNPVLRDNMAKFCTDFAELSGTEKEELDKIEQKQLSRGKIAPPCSKDLYTIALQSFFVFAEDGKTVEQLTSGEGGNTTLAGFLALDEVYTFIKPQQLLEQAMEANDEDNIKAVALFILANFSDGNAHGWNKRNAHSMIRNAMKAFASEEANNPANINVYGNYYDFTTDTYLKEQAQKKLATAVVSIMFTKTNTANSSQRPNKELLISLSAAAQYDPRVELARYRTFNMLTRFVYSVAKLFGFTPKFWLVTDDMHTRILKKIEAGNRVGAAFRAHGQSRYEHHGWYLPPDKIEDPVEIDRHHIGCQERGFTPLGITAYTTPRNNNRTAELLDVTHAGRKELTAEEAAVDPKNEEASIRQHLADYASVVHKVLAIAKQRKMQTPRVDAILKREVERCEMIYRKEWHPPLTGLNGYNWENEDGVPDGVFWFDDEVRPYDIETFDPVSEAFTHIRIELEVARRHPNEKERIEREFRQRRYDVATVRKGQNPPTKEEGYGPKTAFYINAEGLALEVDILEGIFEEVKKACIASGLRLSELEAIEAHLGIDVIELGNIAQVLGIKLSNLPEYATGGKGPYLIAVAEKAQEAARQATEVGHPHQVDIEALNLPNTHYPLNKLINYSVITGLSLKDLDRIAANGYDFQRTRMAVLAAIPDTHDPKCDSANRVNLASLKVIQAAIAADIELPAATKQIILDEKLYELGDLPANLCPDTTPPFVPEPQAKEVLPLPPAFIPKGGTSAPKQVRSTTQHHVFDIGHKRAHVTTATVEGEHPYAIMYADVQTPSLDDSLAFNFSFENLSPILKPSSVKRGKSAPHDQQETLEARLRTLESPYSDSDQEISFGAWEEEEVDPDKLNLSSGNFSSSSSELDLSSLDDSGVALSETLSELGEEEAWEEFKALFDESFQGYSPQEQAHHQTAPVRTIERRRSESDSADAEERKVQSLPYPIVSTSGLFALSKRRKGQSTNTHERSRSLDLSRLEDSRLDLSELNPHSGALNLSALPRSEHSLSSPRSPTLLTQRPTSPPSKEDALVLSDMESDEEVEADGFSWSGSPH